MERTKISGDRIIPLDLPDEELNCPDFLKPSLASRRLASRFGLSPDMATIVAGLVGLPQTEEQ